MLYILQQSVALAALLVGVASQATADKPIILRGAKLLIGDGAVVEDADLIVEGDRIAGIRPRIAEAPRGSQIIDVSGRTIIPGIIAAHAHVGQVDGLDNGAANYNRENILRQLQQYQAYGITTVASLGLNGPLFYELRERLHSGDLPGADLFGADRGIGVADGAPPAATLNVGPDQIDRPMSADDARESVRAAKRRGADLVKIWVDDFRGAVPVKMDPEVYAAVIEEAHKQELRVAAHVYYLADAKRLAALDVDVLAHGVRDQPVDDELIELLKSKGVYYIPTIGVDESAFVYADQPPWMKSPFFLASLQPALRAQFENQAWRQGILANRKLAASRDAVAMNQRNVKALQAAGVKLGFGADSGANPVRIPGFAEHRELQLLCEAGLTPDQALQAATANSAALLGLEDRGTLAPGKLADFVILGADPTEGVEHLQMIESVWRRGRQVAGPVLEFQAVD